LYSPVAWQSAVVISHERREEGVPISQNARTGQLQLLDQPVLQDLVRRSTRTFAWLELAQMMTGLPQASK
jgi:hypothetical protein